MKSALLSFAAATLTASGASTQTPPTTPVAVVVAVTTPTGVSRPVIEAGIRKSLPQYRTVPGLLRKYFTIGETTFDGVHLFTSRAAAQSWFSDAWSQRIVKTYGTPAAVTYYDVPVALDNAEVPASARAAG